MTDLSRKLRRDYTVHKDQPYLDDGTPYVCTGGVYEPSSEVIQSLHYHDHIELGICIEGSGEIYVDGIPTRYSAGDATVLFVDQLHFANADEGSDARWIFMAFSLKNLLAASSFASRPELLKNVDESFCGTGLIDHTVYPEEAAYISSVIARSAKGFENAEAALFTLLSVYEMAVNILKPDLLPDIRQTRKALRELSPLVDYISVNYAGEISVEELATMIFISPQSLYRKFANAYGCSPIEFIHRTRIRVACGMIASGDYSMTEISQRVGYKSISSFNRQFQKSMLCSPSEWARINKTLNR